MATVVRDLLEQLRADPFRETHPFTHEIASASERLIHTRDAVEAADILGAWLSLHQPCVFGKITARLGGLAYCFLWEENLSKTDEEIRDLIQAARRRWRARAFKGEKSGFVILVVSTRIATAIPDHVTKALAKRLCELYLGRDEDDEILLEDVFLRIPGKEDALIHFKVGVNYFCAQADQRWWRDHRIPGGMAFSMNSVGHFVKSFQVGRSLEEAWQSLGLHEQEHWSNFKIDSLPRALVAAMQTINGAYPTEWGTATQLLPADRPGANPSNLKCPIDLPPNLRDKDFCEYGGFYHTDVTLPSEYFRLEQSKPAGTPLRPLDFTYLFHKDLSNPAHFEMGEGIQVKTGSATSSLEAISAKFSRAHGEERLIADFGDLIEDLQRDG